MARSDVDLIADVRAAAAAAWAIAGGVDRQSLANLPVVDDIRYRALKNALTEIGEAIRMLPPRLLIEQPSVNWRGFVGLRNIIAHQYFALEPEILRVVVNEDIPALIKALDAVEASARRRSDHT